MTTTTELELLRLAQFLKNMQTRLGASRESCGRNGEQDQWDNYEKAWELLERQHAELSSARAEAKHWRSNHDNVAAQLRIFTQRPDIPVNLADRLPWYREMRRLQDLEAQAAAALNPVQAGALEASIRELDAWTARADGNELTPSESESVMLVLHELKRLQAAPPAQAGAGINIDFKQATELLAMFGGEPAEITLMTGDGHSGYGLYASYTDMPEEGAEFLGTSDAEAAPAAPAQAALSDDQAFHAAWAAHVAPLAKKFDTSSNNNFFAAGWNARSALLATAPAQAAPESHTQALEAIATWPVTDMLMNMDAANMRGIAQRALAAPAQQQDDRAAFRSYLQECDDCAIVPDVAGAFNAGWTAATRPPAQEHATQLAGQEFPAEWRKQFADAVYEDLAAADNQDVPLEEYPARILKVLDGIVGPRHPAVVQWRNDAIRQCIAIAYMYCRDPESHGYLKQDLQALIAAAPAQAQDVPTPWLPYLSDRADGVKGHYAIARHNPAGYREVWNLRGHRWGSASDEVLTRDEALAILRKLEMTAAPAQAQDDARDAELVAIEELAQLGYRFEGGKMVPPDFVGELLAVVQAAPCGCRAGTCETKSGRTCRMTQEISATQAQKDASEDTVRLDYLDARNAAKNERHGTRYGWGLSENHNRIALDDCHAPVLTVREAIDAARAAAQKGGA